jgi:hypothetical protein
METEMGFYADLYWVKMRATARGEIQFVGELEKAFPKLRDKEYSLKLEHYGRVREAMSKAFTMDELRSMLHDELEPVKH